MSLTTSEPVVVEAPPAPMEDPAGLSKKKAKKAKKVTQKIKVTPGSVDAMVQHTNDDSVVSKRSAVTHSYIDDSFLRHFVKKPSRRSPLINRGYYLRMKVIDDTITHLIRYYTQRTQHTPVQVVSLGAGFDTYALRALMAPREDMPATSNVYFYDVDFPAVMQNKAALMRAAPVHTFPDTMQLQPEVRTHTVKSVHYNAVGVDLREAASTLVPLLRAASETFSTEEPTIIYAECVMQYMPAKDAQQLIHFIAQTFHNAIFLAYDQIHPSDSFGHVMQQSLRQKSSPLLGIDARPDGRVLTKNALTAGMASAWFANFYDLSRDIISGAERDRVAALEPFDELEEWAEMCEHYGITLATTHISTADCVADVGAFKLPSDVPPCAVPNSKESLTASAHTWPTGRFGVEGWGNGGSCVEAITHGGPSAPNGVEDLLIVSFGGFVVARAHERVNSVFVHSLREGELRVAYATETRPPALCFHTVTRIAPFTYVVFGGRTNPTDVHDTAFLLTLQVPAVIELGCHVTATWRTLRVTSPAAPSPRYRHMASTLAAPDHALIVFGGKTQEGTLRDDCWRAVVDVAAGTIAWTSVPLSGTNAVSSNTLPPPTCSATLTLAPHSGLVYLVGGALEGEVCASTVYTIDPNSGACQKLAGVNIGGRFSHSTTVVSVSGREQLFILGGSTCEEKETIAPAVLLSLGSHDVTPVALPAGSPWWSRHTCLTLARGTVAVIAGGYTCFSFGTFTARPAVLRLGEDRAPWPLVWGAPADAKMSQGEDAADSGANAPHALYTLNAPSNSYARLLSLPRPAVEVLPYTPANFLSVARAATRPVVFRRVSLGPCVSRWASTEYLKKTEGDATVSVHVAEGGTLLDFVRKNFVHRHVRFAELVDHVVDATRSFQATHALPQETWYYRSIAAHMKSDRANLWHDFPVLGADFELPEGAKEFILPRVHQSCLRINAVPLQLWTHYDTQDNVLCQIVGRKRVVLFPPSCHNDLYMTGSSSPVLNIDAPDLLKYPRFIEACKHALEVTLEPGDMLYFPANWFHHITTLNLADQPVTPDQHGDTAPAAAAAVAGEGHTVSVNVFFRHFDEAEYDPKDLYGNKDLPVCTALRVQLVSTAEKQVADTRLRSAPDTEVPAAYTRFTLHQAIQDLERRLAAEAASAEGSA